MNNSKKIYSRSERAITLIALIVTIIVLLILAGVTINLAVGNQGIIKKAKKATDSVSISEEKEQIELAYTTANMEKLGNEVSAGDLLNELRKSQDVEVSPNIDGTINVLYKNTAHNYKVNNGKVEQTEVDNSSVAMFDTGKNVAKKMRELAGGADGGFGEEEGVEGVLNVSIDAIKRYKGTPDLSKMTDANIVSWTDGYTAYEASPESYKNLIPEGTKLCPIYMWFEESEKSEIRDISGNLNLKEIKDNNEKEVKTGTIYWWCESNNVYLNFDSSMMFGELLYLSDISGLQYMKTNYTNNMSKIFCSLLVLLSFNQSLESLDSLSCWNVSNVTDFSYAFGGNYRLKDIKGLENWNVSNVTDMSEMFGATRITDTSALSNWNVSNVTDMSGMFDEANITDISAFANWDVSNVTNMRNMFSSCNNLKDASGINDWNIEKVTNFNSMFSGCPTHPEFTKRAGTWDDNGTFTPNS